MPVGRVAREARDLQAENHPDAPHAHLGHHPLESFTIPRGRGGVTQIAVDNDDLVARPPEGDGAVAQPVLTLGALRVLENLSHRGLPHIEQGSSLEVAWRNLLVLLSVHKERPLGCCPLFTIGTSSSVAIAMLATRRTMAPTSLVNVRRLTRSRASDASRSERASRVVQVDHASNHVFIPSRWNSASPSRWPPP